jgi:hypothetical protein
MTKHEMLFQKIDEFDKEIITIMEQSFDLINAGLADGGLLFLIDSFPIEVFQRLCKAKRVSRKLEDEIDFHCRYQIRSARGAMERAFDQAASQIDALYPQPEKQADKMKTKTKTFCVSIYGFVSPVAALKGANLSALDMLVEYDDKGITGYSYNTDLTYPVLMPELCDVVENALNNEKMHCRLGDYLFAISIVEN